MHNLQNLQDLFVYELRDLYSAEQQLTTALPKMAQAASTPELRDAFNHHLQQTQNHIIRLDTIFSELGTTGRGKECQAMKGLIKEGEEIINSTGSSVVKDAALIGAAQRVEHYEIASYGTARTYAQELGYGKVADLLQETLNEEGKANKKLTSLAEGGLLQAGINEKAVA
jgi:ferritin-like metal-binding protein YciE